MKVFLYLSLLLVSIQSLSTVALARPDLNGTWSRVTVKDLQGERSGKGESMQINVTGDNIKFIYTVEDNFNKRLLDLNGKTDGKAYTDNVVEGRPATLITRWEGETFIFEIIREATYGYAHTRRQIVVAQDGNSLTTEGAYLNKDGSIYRAFSERWEKAEHVAPSSTALWGTWKLISTKAIYPDGRTNESNATKEDTLIMFNDTHVTYFSMSVDKVRFRAGGIARIAVQGNQLTETIEYSSARNLGKVNRFTYRIAGRRAAPIWHDLERRPGRICLATRQVSNGSGREPTHLNVAQPAQAQIVASCDLHDADVSAKFLSAQ